MKIVISKHAKEQARERGISINEIKNTIQKGSKVIQYQNKIEAKYIHIKIIFKKIEDLYFIITVIVRSEKNGK